ncbi:ABC transporter G family member 18 [Ceratobasidium sp. AG-Ba]|nr:ABC transporter G family member 18 [Ceratobasidium sp. AG-Ba]
MALSLLGGRIPPDDIYRDESVPGFKKTKKLQTGSASQTDSNYRTVETPGNQIYFYKITPQRFMTIASSKLVLYQAKGTEDPKLEEKFFCKLANGRFILADDLNNRTNESAAKLLMLEKGRNPQVYTYDQNLNRERLSSELWTNDSRRMTGAKIVANFKELVTLCDQVKAGECDFVKARFWNQQVDGIKLYFTHGPGIRKNQLEACIEKVVNSSTGFKPTEYQLKELDAMMKRDDTTAEELYKAIREIETKYSQDRRYADTNAPPWSTITHLHPNKLRKAIKAKRQIDQKAAMNGHSATEIANIFEWNLCSDELPSGRTHRAEWLHRSAFSYGGLGYADSKLVSSQTAKNLIFGSVESNTFMIRPENTIKHLVSRLGAQRALESDDEYEKRLKSMTSLGTVFTIVNRYLDQGESVWLVGSMTYTFELKLSRLSPSLANPPTYPVEIDPFSRATPLLLEASLDELVEDVWIDGVLDTMNRDWHASPAMPVGRVLELSELHDLA